MKKFYAHCGFIDGALPQSKVLWVGFIADKLMHWTQQWHKESNRRHTRVCKLQTKTVQVGVVASDDIDEENVEMDRLGKEDKTYIKSNG